MTAGGWRRVLAAGVALEFLIALPVLYQVLCPRLGPLSAAEFHLFAGMAALFLPLPLVVANLLVGWLTAGYRRWLTAAGLLWVAIFVADRTYVSWSLGRQLQQAGRVAELRRQCTVTQPPDYYERGAQVYCRDASGRLHQLWVSNGPWPWSDWQVEDGR